MELDDDHRVARVINIIIPICARLANQPIFRREDNLLQQHLAGVIAREMDILLRAGEDVVPAQAVAEVVALADDVSMASASLSDGCVTASETSVAADLGEGSMEGPTEADFVAGVRDTSSPRSDGSSGSHVHVVPTVGTSGGMSTDQQQVRVSDSDDSSDLSSIILPGPVQENRTVPIVCPESPILISSSSSDSSHFSSVSRHVIRNHIGPSPLFDVSISEVGSTTSTEFLRAGPRVSGEDIDMRALSLFREAARNGVWGVDGSLYRNKDHRRSMWKVARWLLDNQGCVCPNSLGSRDNPILIED